MKCPLGCLYVQASIMMGCLECSYVRGNIMKCSTGCSSCGAPLHVECALFIFFFTHAHQTACVLACMANKEQFGIRPHALIPHKEAPGSLGRVKKQHGEDLEAGSSRWPWQRSFTSGLEIRRPENSTTRNREIQQLWRKCTMELKWANEPF